MDQEYLIATHIADIALTLMVEERKHAQDLWEKYRKEFKDKAKKASAEFVVHIAPHWPGVTQAVMKCKVGGNSSWT